MELILSNTYESLSTRAAADLWQLLQPIEKPLLCTASGDSPAGLYGELVRKVKAKGPGIAPWHFVGLDEWGGMNGNDEGSCRYYLDKQLFNPLRIEDQRICFFDGRAGDLQKECEKTETFIRQHGGMDVAILGLGMNGHVGMNEPGVSASLRSHVANIDPVTQKTGQKYFSEPKQLTKGITLGLATILEAKNIFLVASGAHKAGIVKKILEEDVSEKLPASLLRYHAGLRVYLDNPAASLINTLKYG